MSMFSGTSNFTLLDEITESILNKFFQKFEKSSGGTNQSDDDAIEVDLRAEIIHIFESIVTIYLFGRDVS